MQEGRLRKEEGRKGRQEGRKAGKGRKEEGRYVSSFLLPSFLPSFPSSPSFLPSLPSLPSFLPSFLPSIHPRQDTVLMGIQYWSCVLEFIFSHLFSMVCFLALVFVSGHDVGSAQPSIVPCGQSFLFPSVDRYWNQ